MPELLVILAIALRASKYYYCTVIATPKHRQSPHSVLLYKTKLHSRLRRACDEAKVTHHPFFARNCHSWADSYICRRTGPCGHAAAVCIGTKTGHGTTTTLYYYCEEFSQQPTATHTKYKIQNAKCKLESSCSENALQTLSWYSTPSSVRRLGSVSYGRRIPAREYQSATLTLDCSACVQRRGSKACDTFVAALFQLLISYLNDRRRQQGIGLIEEGTTSSTYDVLIWY